MGERFRGVFLATMAKGRVRRVELPVNEKAVRAAITRNGGVDVPLD